MISRPYHKPADLEAVIQLLLNSRPAQWISDYPSIQDLRELLSLPDMQASLRLWETSTGSLAGFALVDAVDNLLFELNPGKTTPEIEDEVVAWGIAHVSQGFHEGRDHPALDATCRAENTARKTFLERHGFVRIHGESVTMIRSLAETIPTPVLPHGFIIRPIAGEHELERYVALHQAAFGTHHMTIENRRAIMHAKDYIPELDLVAESSEGVLAALCVCQISTIENSRAGRLQGQTDPVATHPSYRRRGLSKALLLTGLSLLKDRGMETARLVTNGDNLPMLHAAGEAGYVISSAIYGYSKAV
jgi:mycothiol synthase